MNLSAYTISQIPTRWFLDEVEWINLVDDAPVDKYNGHTLEYVRYLADKRNRAVAELLEKYPETTDVLCCDSHYVGQTQPLRNLIRDYYRVKETILGAAIYGPWRQRLRDVLFPRTVFSDPWGVPDLAWTKPGMKGMVESTGMTGIHIFPVSTWKSGARYQAYENTDLGTDISRFARSTRLDIMIDMDAAFYRDRRYSRVKSLRCTLGLGTKLRKLGN